MKSSDYRDAGGWVNTVKGLCACRGIHPRFYASFYRSFCPSRRHVCSLGTPSFILIKSGGSNSVVECDLAKVEVAGSNPVSRSNDFSCQNIRVHLMHHVHQQGVPRFKE